MNLIIDERRETALEPLLVGAVLAFIVLIPVYHDIGRNFLANSDADVVLAYLALQVTSGLPLDHFDHTGYVHVLLYAAALWLAESIGWIETANLGEIAAAPGFERLVTEVVVVGRVLSIAMALVSAAVLWAVARVVTGQRWVALLGLGLFAGSLGLGDQYNVIRTELPSTMFLLSGFLALCLAGKCRDLRALAWLAGAACCGYLAVMVKLQAVFVVLFFPLLGVALTGGKEQPLPALRQDALPVRLGLATLFVAPAAVWLVSLLPEGRWGIYQAAILAYVALAAMLAARWRGADWRWGVSAFAAVLVGLACGQYVNVIKDSWTSYAVFNFLEAMAGIGGGRTGTGNIGDILGLPGYAAAFAATYLGPSALTGKFYPFMLVYWAAAFGVVVLFARRQPRPAILATLLLAMGVALPTVFSIRAYLYHYTIYVEPWVVLAAAVALAAVLERSRWRIPVFVAATLVCLAVTGVQTRYRLLAPAMANTRPANTVCAILVQTPQFAGRLKPYCDRARGG